MRRMRNIKDKYFKRDYLWDRVKLGNHRVSSWRSSGQVIKLYERWDGERYTPFYRTAYEVTD